MYKTMFYSIKRLVEESGENVIFYLNLTNGLECLQTMKALDITPKFVQIQSTKIERQKYDDIICELGADFMLNIAVGKKCCVIDYGANKKNSKSIYKGVQFIKYACERSWFGKTSERPFLLKRHNDEIMQYVDKEFDHIYSNLNRNTKRLLKKYKKYALLNEKEKIDLIGLSESTTNDNDDDFYLRIVKNLIVER